MVRLFLVVGIVGLFLVGGVVGLFPMGGMVGLFLVGWGVSQFLVVEVERVHCTYEIVYIIIILIIMKTNDPCCPLLVVLGWCTFMKTADEPCYPSGYGGNRILRGKRRTNGIATCCSSELP